MILEDKNGDFFEVEKRKIREAKNLCTADYKDLLKQEKWEIYNAICYLTGYSVVGEDVFCNDRDFGTIRKASKQAAFLYRGLLEDIKNGDLITEGVILDYPQNSTWAQRNQGKCFVSPYAFLKWVCLKGMKMPPELQFATRLFQNEWFLGKNYFTEPVTQQFPEPRITDKNRLITQAIAQILWHLDPQKRNKSNIEKEIKRDVFLNRLCQASNYQGKNTFQNWLATVDPRDEGCRRGNQKEYLGNIQFMPIEECFYWRNWFGIKPIPIYDFQRLRLVISTYASVLFYKNPSLIPEDVFVNPIVQLYTDPESEFAGPMIQDWIKQSYISSSVLDKKFSHSRI